MSRGPGKRRAAVPKGVATSSTRKPASAAARGAKRTKPAQVARVPRSVPAQGKPSQRSTPPSARSGSLARSAAVAPAPGDAGGTLATLAHTFFQLLMRHRAYFRTALANMGFSFPQIFVLQHIEDSTMTMRELAEVSGIEPSNLTGIVDKLEARGLVERRASREDRRVKLVCFTRAGQTFRDRLRERLQGPTPWMVALAEADQAQLLSLLRKALASMQGADPEDEGA